MYYIINTGSLFFRRSCIILFYFCCISTFKNNCDYYRRNKTFTLKAPKTPWPTGCKNARVKIEIDQIIIQDGLVSVGLTTLCTVLIISTYYNIKILDFDPDGHSRRCAFVPNNKIHCRSYTSIL